MKTYRSVTAAAIIGAAGAIGALSIGSALGQPATQPDQRPGQPTTQPGQPGQPGQRPTMTPGQQRGTTANERLFALEGAGAERQIQQLAQRLNQIEQQMQRTNQQLSQQVSRLDTMQGEEKINAIGNVLEEIVNEHEQLHTYLTELRTALTGPTSSPGATTPGTPGQPSRPGQSERPGE